MSTPAPMTRATHKCVLMRSPNNFSETFTSLWRWSREESSGETTSMSGAGW
jgi:hypothetical protein